MQIALLTTQFAAVGGVENVVREIASRLATEHEISLVTRQREQNTDEFEDYFTDVHIIEDTESYTSYLRKGRKFFKQYRDEFDVMHAHNWSPVLALVGLDIPTVMTLHGTTYNVVRDQSSTLKALPYWPIEELALQVPDVVTSITRSHLQPFHTVKPVEIIRNGVDLERFRPRPNERDELRERWDVDGLDILTVGSHIPRKGHKEVLLAASQLDQDCTVMIPSRGPLTDQLRELADELDVTARFYGRVPDGTLPELYSSADVFCLPSKGEGLPLAMLEAMASGLPVIVSDVGDNHEIVEESGAGWAITPDSTAIYHALETADDLEGRGWRARAHAEDELGWDTIVNEYVEVYREAMP